MQFLIFLLSSRSTSLFEAGTVTPVYMFPGIAAPTNQKLLADLNADLGANMPQGATKGKMSKGITGNPTAFMIG